MHRTIAFHQHQTRSPSILAGGGRLSDQGSEAQNIFAPVLARYSSPSMPHVLVTPMHAVNNCQQCEFRATKASVAMLVKTGPRYCLVRGKLQRDTWRGRDVAGPFELLIDTDLENLSFMYS